MIDHDNTVKAYSVSPSTLGRGHVLLEPDGPVWVRATTVTVTALLNKIAERQCVGLSRSASGRFSRRLLRNDQHSEINEERRVGRTYPVMLISILLSKS
jgi:hypothetical protein